MRIDPAMGSIEVGGINYGRQLQRSRAATEAMALLMRHAFDDLGYRRFEWKCDSLNAPSRRPRRHPPRLHLGGPLPQRGGLQGAQP
jgi:RimJ/RimL family protein N-acetyltransferase